jgi:hypothetical protein
MPPSLPISDRYGRRARELEVDREDRYPGCGGDILGTCCGMDPSTCPFPPEPIYPRQSYGGLGIGSLRAPRERYGWSSR